MWIGACIRLLIVGLRHVSLSFYCVFTNAIDHNVRMDIAVSIVTIGMCHDKSLVSWKYFFGKV